MNISNEQGLPPLQRGDSFNLSDTGTFQRTDFKVSRDGIGGLDISGEERRLRGVKIVLDDLEMTEELGQGASGIVRKAIHKPTGVIVAVKTVNITDKGKRSQMVNELRSLTQSQCPFLVGLHDAFYEEMQVRHAPCARASVPPRTRRMAPWGLGAAVRGVRACSAAPPWCGRYGAAATVQRPMGGALADVRCGAGRHDRAWQGPKRAHGASARAMPVPRYAASAARPSCGVCVWAGAHGARVHGRRRPLRPGQGELRAERRRGGHPLGGGAF